MTQARSRYLRKAAAGQHHRVTFVELFFDLVFVFAVTQISHTLLEHFSFLTAVETLLLMLAVWWAWIYTSWSTNWLDPERTPVRLLLFGLMICGLIVSASLPKAFESRGLFFAGALVAMQIGRTAFAAWLVRNENEALYRNFLRILAWFCLSGVFWIAGGFADGHTRLAIWSIALVLDYIAPSVRFWTPGLNASTIADWTVEGGHMAERCALFIIIALGESLLVTGATFARLDWSTETFLAFLAAFVGSVAMWWIYFDRGAEDGSERIAHARDPGRIARLAYTYIHLPIVAGIVVSAVSDEMILAHPGGHTAPAVAVCTIGGPLLFLVGCILFKRAIRGWFMLSHLCGIAALLVLAPFYLALSPLGFYGLATAILVIVAIWETVSLRSK